MRIIAGEYRGRRLKTGSGPGYRPATGKVREALFSILESRQLFWPDTRVLDLFAGSGSLGMEALSRGAQEAVFVDQSSYAIKMIKENMGRLDIPRERARVKRQKVGSFLEKGTDSGFDLVFIDPPYRKDMFQAVLPKVFSMGWLPREGLLCAEVERNIELDPNDYQELRLLKDRNFGQTRILLWIRTN